MINLDLTRATSYWDQGGSMRNLVSWKRAVATFVGLVAGIFLLAVIPANAQSVTEGSFTASGDPGDWVTGGGSYSYKTGAGDVMNVSGNGNHVAVSVDGKNGDYWTLDLAAIQGKPLVRGVYDGALRYPFQGAAAPGLDFSGNHRGCNELSGTFTIQDIAFGPNGYVHKLHATFVQHCEHGAPAARGEVHIDNAPPPAELDLGLDISVEGEANSINGKAYVKGTVSCTAAAKVTISGRVTQIKDQVLIRGDYTTQVDCKPGGPVPWTAAADPTGTTPFQAGKAEVLSRASAVDPTYGNPVTEEKTTIVTLRKV